MQMIKGIAVSPGYAIGEAYVLDDAHDPVFPQRFIRNEDIDAELARFQEAVVRAQNELRSLVDNQGRDIGTEAAPIFQAHIAMLSDGGLNREVTHRIKTQRFSVEYAVHCAIKYFKRMFTRSGNMHLAQRVGDLTDIERGLQTALQGQRDTEFRQLDRPVILVARDLTPAQTARLDKKRVIGFATDLGGSTGHTAIVARARDIPAVVGTHALVNEVSGGDTLIVDGKRGVVIVNPDPLVLTTYRARARAYQERETRMNSTVTLPAQTRDGVPVQVLANIEFPDELDTANQYGAVGVGLFRTEFLYTGRDGDDLRDPDEETHFRAYRDMLQALDGRPATIRTTDLGADKFFNADPDFTNEANGKNPALGLRAVRYCLRRPDLFRQQLRAICRASAFGRVQLMVPMISAREEVEQVRDMLAEVQDHLAADGVEFDHEMPFGIMVEVPSVAFDIERYMDLCDFFSIGTNDLIQYMLAVDRANALVGHLYSAGHPAILRLIKHVVDRCDEAGKPIGLCGAMAAEPEFVALLLGLGLRHFSMSPPMMPLVKSIIRSVTVEETAQLAREVLELDSRRAIMTRLAKFNAPFLGDSIVDPELLMA